MRPFRNVNTDIEPIYTFRKHSGPVLSVLVGTGPNADTCISSGLDGNIIVWNIPNMDTTDQYDPYCKICTYFICVYLYVFFVCFGLPHYIQ